MQTRPYAVTLDMHEHTNPRHGSDIIPHHWFLPNLQPLTLGNDPGPVQPLGRKIHTPPKKQMEGGGGGCAVWDSEGQRGGY